MSNALNLAAKISALKPSEVIRCEDVKNQFITVYNAVWKDGGEKAYEREAVHFQKILREKKELSGCTSLSIFFAFIDLAVQGISLEPGPRAMCYLLPRSVKKTSPDGRDMWEKRCNLSISGYGDLYLRERSGQILHADNPVIVYEGDEFDYGEKDGKKFVNFHAMVPRKSNRIIACFIKITRTDMSIDYSVMLENDWKRLEGFSRKNSSYKDSKGVFHEKVNELYQSQDGGIDPSFLAAKCIKHAFRSYPKLNIGKGSVLETDEVDSDMDDPYMGLDNDLEPVPVQDDADTSGGVMVQDKNSDDVF